MVIIMVSFVSILVSVCVYAAYYNFFMKYNDRSAKDNFYTVETALDEINLGLQREISNSMAECYMNTNKQANLSVQEKADLFKSGITTSLQKKLQLDSSNPGLYRIDKLTLYLDKTRYNTSTNVGAKILTRQKPDASNPNLPYAQLVLDGDKLILKNVSLQYTDPRGYVSMLTTDIAVKMPDVSFAANKEVPDLENYSLIADESLKMEPSTTTAVNGNVYGGHEDGIVSSDHSRLTFGDAAGSQNKVIAAKVTAESGDSHADLNSIRTLKGSQLWTGAIDVTSANITLEDETYVEDDLTVDGKKSRITLAGQYFGYGNNGTGPEGSSSILINGAETTLNLKRLEGLMLMGHAFVGARHYDSNTSESTDYVENVDDIGDPGSTGNPKNVEDQMLGQSVAVKSDQLMYMVPLECMGYENDENGKPNGRQVLAKNPITLAEHNMLNNTKKLDSTNNPTDKLKYSEVALDKTFAKLGRSVQDYGAEYRKVFRKVNGSILVYYYLHFSSETMANKFFSDYYAADKDALDSYIKEYIAGFELSGSLRSSTSSLHIAGNLVYFDDAGKAVLRADTKAEDMANIEDITNRRETIMDTYEALSTKLLTSKENISATELGQSVYQNVVVDDVIFNAIVPPDPATHYTTKEFTNGLTGLDEIKAIGVNNKGGAPYQITSAANLYLVVASGDVEVKVAEFHGLIIAGGTITIFPACTQIEKDPIMFQKAMNTKESTGVYYAADLLKDKDAYLNYSTVSANTSEATNEYGYIDIADLIYYENWSKE